MQDRTELPQSLTVTSDAFGANGSIPLEHAQDGGNAPPHLAWSTVPEGTRSIAVIVEDPDAPTRTFVHWIVVGIPPTETELDGELPDGAVHGTNDRGLAAWSGPQPPSGRHRYFFKVFALDIALASPNLTKYEVYAAMKGHILAQGELIGTFEKPNAFIPPDDSKTEPATSRGKPRAHIASGLRAHTGRRS